MGVSWRSGRTVRQKIKTVILVVSVLWLGRGWRWEVVTVVRVGGL